MKQSAFLISAAVAFAVLLFILLDGTAQNSRLYLQNRNYHVQTALFELYRPAKVDVVMLGNSLTQWVDWKELLGRSAIVNRGIASDITEGYLHRLHQVVKLRPKLCFIEGGINDLYAEVPVDTVFGNYVMIVQELRTHGIVPIIQSTLFVSPKWRNAVEKNVLVRDLNTRLRAYAIAKGIEFIDLNARMSPNDLLRDDLTHDGVHLTAAGYAIWAAEVEAVLKRHGL